MSTSAGTPEGEAEKAPTKKNGRPLTIWDVHAGSDLSLRQHIFWLSVTWGASGGAGLVYWRVRSVQKHGEVTDNDIAQLPLLGGVHLVLGLIVAFVYCRYVLPAARRDLARLQQDAKSQNTHSSTTTPES